MKKRLTTKDFKQFIQSFDWTIRAKDAEQLASIYKGFADFTDKLIKEGKARKIMVKRQCLCFIWENGNGCYFLDNIGVEILLPQIEEICQERGFELINYDVLTAIAA